MASTITMLTRPRRHRRVVRCTLGAVVKVFSNRSVFTRARLLRGGPLCPPRRNYNAKKRGKTHPPNAPGRVHGMPQPLAVWGGEERRGLSVTRCQARSLPPGHEQLGTPGKPPGSILFGFPDMILSVKLKPEAGDKFKLRFEEVDVLLLITHQFFEQIPGHVILDAMAMTRRLLIKGTRGHLSRKIAI